MHKDLELAFQRVVEILKEDARCKGGWHYGSISRESEDVYSDYDPVFLQDAEEICKAKGIDYPDTIARQIISYFNRRMDSEDWV